MKRILLFLFLVTGLFLPAYAQFTPQGFNYQSIVRDVNGNALSNQTVTLLLSIRSGSANGPIAYSEKQVVSTNDYGLINLVIGQGGTVLTGAFNNINWGGGAKFLTVSVETSPNVFDELGTSELMSVPYALYAANGGGTGTPPDNWGTQAVQTNATLSGNGTITTPLSLAQQGAQTGQVLKWNGTSWVPDNDLNTVNPTNGTVTQVNTGAGLTGGPISTTGTISLSNTTVTPGTYGSSSQIPVITIDPQGRVTGVTNVIASPGFPGIPGPGISIQQNGNQYLISNTGDTNPNDDLTAASQADGDVSGPLSNLQIKPSAVGSNEIATDAVGSSEIDINAVGTAELANGAVTTGKITDGAVTTPKIGNGAVTAAKIDDMGATNGQVLKWNGTVWAPAPDQSGGGPGNTTLTAGAGISVTGSSPDFTVTNTGDTNPSDDLTTTSQANGDVAGPFNNLQLKNDVVTSAEIAGDAVGSSEIKDNAVGTSELTNGAVTAAKLDDMGANSGQVLKWNGTAWAPAADQTGGGGGTTTVQAGIAIDVVDNGNGLFIVSNAGDINPNDDLTTTSQADGDLTGPFDNLQLKPLVVTNAELAANAVASTNLLNGSVTAVKLNNMGAALGQVLKWNGTVWAPDNDLTGNGTGGDNWGTQVAVTDNTTIAGAGTNAAPLRLAPQGATTGQVLKWNGTSWAPAADQTGTGVGDNWGTQTTETGSTLKGDGTPGSPLDLANQNAGIGQVLKWNGTSWAPDNDLTGVSVGGDNWGTQVVITNNTIDGSGTNADPLKIATQGASNGQVLKFNGTTWVPAADNNSGGNTYSAGNGINITGSTPNFTITNSGDLSNTNELQTLNLNGNQLSLSNGGGTVNLPGGNTYTAGNGISITGSAPNLTITNTGDADNSPTNELQTVSLVGPVLTLSGNNSMIDFTALLDDNAGFWKKFGNDITNTNTGDVVIGSMVGNSGKLQVTSNNGHAAGHFTLNNSSSNNYALYAETNGNSGAGFFTSTDGPAIVTGSGNVGINTSTPAFRLDVAGNQRNLSTGAQPQLTLEQGGSDFARLLMKSGGSASTWLLQGKGAGTGSLFNLDLAVGASDKIRFLTAKGSGDLLVGDPIEGPVSLTVYHENKGLVLENTNGGDNWEFLVNAGDGSLLMFANGSIAGSFATNGVYTASDRRLKKDIAALPGVLNKLMGLQPVSYRFNQQAATDKLSYGFLAQDVQGVFPELVGHVPEHNGNPSYLSVNYSGFGVLAVRAIQEQQTKIERLEQDNAELRERLESLEARMSRLEKLVEDKN